MKKRRTIRVKRSQYIDEGDFGAVYRISKYRIVKVYHCEWKKFSEELVEDEIKGSKRYRNALPVLEVVNVFTPHSKYPRLGIIRPYVPYEADYCSDIKKKELHLSWDSRSCNFRKDSRGNIWRVDTQTRKILRIIGDEK
jgi:hypothetical protein